MVKNFHTFREYMKNVDKLLTASMEDYLEMIYRLSCDNGFTRIHELSSALNVQPPSATKMVQKLSKLKLIKYEKYGYIILEDCGKELGELLLRRHNTIENFLKLLGIEENEILQETEKIEHTINKKTVKSFAVLVSFFNENPDIKEKFIDYQTQYNNSKT